MPIKFLNDVAVDSSVLYVDTINNRVGVGTSSPSETFTLQTQGDGLGNEGIFIKNPFAGTTPIVNSKSPFLSLGTSTTSAYNSTIYMGRNATATDQESKIEWSNANNGLSIYVKGTGTYREHVRFGNLSSSTPKTYFSGNVGITTSSPSAPLHIYQLSNSGLKFSRASHDDIDLSLEGGDRFVISNTTDGLDIMSMLYDTGNVGIGTTSPATKLHIGTSSTSGTTTEEFRIQSGTSSGNGGTAIANLVTGAFGTSGIYFGNQSTYTSQDAYLQYADSNNATTLNFSSSLNLESGSSGSRMYINSSGNVGIGTTSPGYKLDVSGSFRATDESTFTSNLLFPDNSRIKLGNSEDLQIYHDGTGSYIRQASGTGDLIIEQAIDDKDIIFKSDNGSGGLATYLTLDGSTTHAYFSNPGNVGIGTTSPQATLHISKGSNDSPTVMRIENVDTTIETNQEVNTIQFYSNDASSSGTGITSKIAQVAENPGNLYGLSFYTYALGLSEALRIKNNGNIGIGTPSPQTKLHVANGTLRTWMPTSGTTAIFESTSNNRSFVTITGANESELWFGDATTQAKGRVRYENNNNMMEFWTGENARMYITSAGNVGIGTDNPGAKLHVSGSQQFILIESTANSDATYRSKTPLGYYGSGTGIGSATNCWNVYDFNAGSERMRISSSGNVGINTTNPNQKLTIRGNDNYVATEQTNYAWGGTNTIGVRMGTDATAGLLDFRRWTGTSAIHGTALITQKNSDGGYGLDFRVDTKTSNTVATTSRMFLSQSGEVGIGTTSPQRKFHVDGIARIEANGQTLDLVGTDHTFIAFYPDGAASGRKAYIGFPGSTSDRLTIANEFNDDISFFTNGSEKVTIENSGNVGIGTTSPNHELVVEGAASPNIELKNSNYSNGGFILNRTNYGHQWKWWAESNVMYFGFSTDESTYSTKLTIESSGDVGIGTTSPGQKLEVEGNIRISKSNDVTSGFELGRDGSTLDAFIIQRENADLFFRTNNSEKMRIEAGGNVGIGTASPGQKLSVNGTVSGSIFYDYNNTGYFFNGDASKDGVDLVTSGNYAINVLGTISGGHRKHGNLETPEMQWSVGGGTDLNWKKLCDIVISDASYSGWGAEIEITNFSGNYGNATYNGGELFKGALSIYHWGGTGTTPEVPYSSIPYEMRNFVRWYKIQESGKNRYELQVKSPGNYQQLYVKVKPGIGNQVADIISYANLTNGTTSGGTAYTSYQTANFNHEFAGGIWTNDSRAIGWKNAYGSPYLSSYYGSITTSTPVYIGGPVGNGQDLYCDDLRSNKVFDRAATAYYFEGGNSGDSIRVAGDVVAYYSSDKRLKDNIKPIENALDKVKAISGVTFEWNEKSHKTTGKKDVGVVAQEIEDVLPELVETRTNGYKAVDYQKLTAVLIESVKELSAKVEALEAKQCNCK